MEESAQFIYSWLAVSELIIQLSSEFTTDCSFIYIFLRKEESIANICIWTKYEIPYSSGIGLCSALTGAARLQCGTCSLNSSFCSRERTF